MYYRAIGDFPASRHTTFQTSDGRQTFEELIGEEGFSGTASHLYHLGIPANLVDSRTWDIGDLSTVTNASLRPRHFRLPDLFAAESEQRNDVVRHRRLVLRNDDVRISYVVADTASPLYSNEVGS